MKPPYLHRLAPFVRDFDKIREVFKSTSSVKLLSLCLGPFSQPNVRITLAVSDFAEQDLLNGDPSKRARGRDGRYEQTVFVSSSQQKKAQYYVFVKIQQSLVLDADFRIRLDLRGSTQNSFYFWLNSSEIVKGFENVRTIALDDRPMRLEDFLLEKENLLTLQQYKKRNGDTKERSDLAESLNRSISVHQVQSTQTIRRISTNVQVTRSFSALHSGSLRN